MFKTIGVIILYCFIITVIHELGHYLMSRKLGLRPDLFKIGVGPVIFKKGILEITLFPLSGSVNHPDDEWAALTQRQQNLIAVAGPLVNLVVGLIAVGWLPLFGMLNLLVFAGNLIPFETSRGNTDGGYVFRGTKSLVRVPASLMLVACTTVLYIQTINLLF